MGKVTYNNKNAVFFRDLKSEVDQYFVENGIRKTGNLALYVKTVVVISVAISTYVFLLTQHYSNLAGVLLCLLLGLALSTVGFNVMHDACHGSYSTRKWVNELLALTMNALGGSAFIWKQKHNIIHHTYTNVDGVDDDIAKSPVLRQCHTQPWKPVHQIQHLYLWLVYALSSFLWIFIIDMQKYGSRRINTTQMAKMDTKEHVIFWLTKVLYVVFYILIPVYVVGWGRWAVGFTCMHVALGLSLSIVFQLAHVIEETDFEFTGDDDKLIENEWAIHQVKTTANFANRSKLIWWLTGGLNFQIEHHLFPRISHIHYPALSKIVARKCQEFGLVYNSLPTMGFAIISHYKFMKMLGSKPSGTVAF